MWKIIPDTQVDYSDLKPKRLGYTYLHGKLETDCGFDCYGFIDCDDLVVKSEYNPYVDDSLLADKEYPCVYNDKPCTLFFWHCKLNRPHGLVVYNDDLEAVEYARKCLSNKEITL